MFKNFIITIIRIACRQRLLTFLNIIGIALGVAVSIILMMHIRWELSYDKFVPNCEKIYRITRENFGDNPMHWATTSTPIYYEVRDFFPEIEAATRITSINTVTFCHKNEKGELIRHEEKGGFYADSTVFDVFGINFIEGSQSAFYSDIHSVVLTKSLAQKFFGKTDPIGKQIIIEGKNTIYTVNGVVEDCPVNTHWRYNFLIPFKTFKSAMLSAGYKDLFFSKWWSGVYNYIRINNKSDIGNVIERLNDFTVQYNSGNGTPEEILKSGVFRLQPLTQIHFSNLEEELTINGNKTYIWVFGISIIFILIVVSVNYVNITTSLALKRLKEVGIKIISGSTQRQLKLQLLGESLIASIFGGILSILIVYLFLPSYNELTSQHFTLSSIFLTDNFYYFLTIVIGLGIVSGIYPAFFITKYRPIDAIKGLKDPSSKSNRFRKTLLVIQFAVSIFMIFSTIGIYKQMIFFQNNQLGFNKENLVSIKLSGALANQVLNNSSSFKQELIKLPAVVAATYCSNIPGERLSVEGLHLPDRDPNAPNPAIRFIRVDKDYIVTLGLELIDGMGFSDDFAQTSSFVISKKTKAVLNLEHPVGKKGSSMFGGEGEIKGVINDYHFASLHQAIEPIVLEYNMGDKLLRGTIRNIILRLGEGNMKNNLDQIEKRIKEIEPNAIVSFTFVDEYLNSLYISEIKMSKLFKRFTIFTIIIACLGLFGITGYNAELKTKEIGIRRVLGASKSSIIKHLSLKFISFITISIIIALPLAYIYITNWLNNFAYHTDVSLINWIFTIIIALVITYSTILFHAIKIANRKPLDVLKCE